MRLHLCLFQREGNSRRGSVTSSNTGHGRGPPNSLTNEENSLSHSASEKAAVTIQTQYRKYQQRKHTEYKP
uniref:Uncharacterized protein n=1 Tax=Callorhinchus milii TaxID=7868 RepID=A0A4W3HIQ2_CALMI